MLASHNPLDQISVQRLSDFLQSTQHWFWETDAELRYTRAIDRYEGGRCDAHLVVIQAHEWRDPAPDAGWSRFARTWEGHVLPGGHVTLITRHLPDLARTIRDAIARATGPHRGEPARV